MTTIIGIQHDSGVTLGFDSLVGSDDLKFEDEATPKVFAHNGIVYGISGSFVLANIVRHADLPNPDVRQTLGGAGWDVDRWVNRDLVPAILDALEQRKCLGYENGKPDLQGAILVVVRGRLYEIDFDTSVSRRLDRRHAIGTGAPYALGALSAGASIHEALEIAASFDSATGGTLKVALAEELLAGTQIAGYPALEAVA